MSANEDEVDQFLWAHERDDVVWMSQNTNYIPLPEAVNEAIIKGIKTREYNHYPYAPGLPALKNVIFKDLGIDEGFEMLLTNGAIEALYILNRALIRGGDEVISSDPAFMPIHHQIESNGGRPVSIPIYGREWKLTPEQINERIGPKTSYILLIDPHNPLGTGYKKDEVKAICEIAEDNDLWLVHDITYRDFAYEHTLATNFFPAKTLLVSSFSKNCGFAGLRFGNLIAPEHIMPTMKRYDTNVLSVNILAQLGALKALETKDEWLPGLLERSRENQQIIKKAVDEVDGAYIPVFPSSTNMLIVDVSEAGAEPDDIQKRMLFDHKVFIRSGRYVSPGFGQRFIRVSFTVSKDGAERFAQAFPAVIRELRD